MGVDGKGPVRVQPGAILRYVGETHAFLRGYQVRVVREIAQGLWEVAPWLPDENRFSFVTSDALASELEPTEGDQ